MKHVIKEPANSTTQDDLRALTASYRSGISEQIEQMRVLRASMAEVLIAIQRTSSELVETKMKCGELLNKLGR